MTYPPPQQPPRRSNNGLIIGLVVGAFVLMVCCPCAVFVAFRPAAAADIVKTITGNQ